VLFLSANPAGTPPLKLDEEIRQITAKVRAAEYRDSLELVSRWAVRPDDLWAENPTGSGLGTIEEAIKELRNP
jgi:hypothetical protein